MDSDGDGQIELDEAQQYIRGEIGGSHFDEAAEWERGATAMLNTLDGTDRDNTISVAELHAHVRESAALPSVEGTAEWIARAIQLPQYAAAFKAARVTALDFPAIVNVPEVLEQEVGCTTTRCRTSSSTHPLWLRVFAALVRGNETC